MNPDPDNDSTEATWPSGATGPRVPPMWPASDLPFTPDPVDVTGMLAEPAREARRARQRRPASRLRPLRPAGIGRPATTDSADPAASTESAGDESTPPTLPTAPEALTPPTHRVAGPSLRFGRPAVVEPSSSPSARGRADAAPAAEQGLVRIGMWGATGGGKTTFLAALKLATFDSADDPARWTVNGATPESSEFLLEMTDLLDHKRRFPDASALGTPLSWHIFGEPEVEPKADKQAGRGWFGSLLGRAGPRRSPVKFILDLQDMPGDWFALGREQDDEVKRSVLGHLASADGLLYLFDPIRDAAGEEGTLGNFQFFDGVLEYLQSRLREGDKLVGERLPHHVAVCITKFDDPALFDTALRTGWVSTHPGTGQPYVPNSHADRFFAWLCAQLPGTGANRVRAALRKYFHEDRVAYFVCSAIGFRIGPGGLFDSRDYANVTIVNGEPRIREAVHPINVLEPVIALERRIRTGSW